jgi:hypothetical protein
LRGIFILVFIKESHSEYVSKNIFHVAISHSNLIIFSTKIMHQSKFDQGAFSSKYSPKNHVAEAVHRNIHTMLPHCIQL